MKDNIGLKRGTVVLTKFHQDWVKAFEVEKSFLQKLIGPLALDIQHIGSTSVPNLSAKPIIDILMAVPSLSSVEKFKETLNKAGYEYRENGSDDTQVLFVKGPEEKRTHYLHITEIGSLVWRNDLAFRNYLITNPKEAAKYEALKLSLASKYAENRGLYTAEKKDYIEGVLRRV